jgi:hypothetical protein
MIRPVSRASRLVGTAGATAALVFTSLGAGASPAASAPSEDCAEPFPIAELTDGQQVHGLTVSKGTTPEPFTGEVIGVLKDGIAAGVDMVMMNLTSSEIDRVGGIWAGMSGSPVYADDGRLIGAVAYGLAGTSPVGGITPFDEMDEYIAPASSTSRVSVSSATARKISAQSNGDVSTAEASNGFRQLPMLTSVSGVQPSRLTQASGKRRWLMGGVRSAGALSGTSAPDADSIVAGGNLGAAVAWGDITGGGVGTATSVCDGKVVGFGHPMEFSGTTTEAMLPASALYIQEDRTFVPFKVANFGPPVGMISQDRLTGIAGAFGELPPATTITDTLTYAGKSRTGVSHVSVKPYTAAVTFYHQLANHDSVLRAAIPGSEKKVWTVTGKDSSGAPFSIAMRDRYVSEEDIAFESPWDLADQVAALSSLKGVRVATVDIADTVTDDTSTYRVARVEQRYRGRWLRISASRPIRARPGKLVTARTVLSREDGTTRVVSSNVMIRSWAAGSSGSYVVSGATDKEEEADEEEEFTLPPTGSLAELLAYYKQRSGADQLAGKVTLRGTPVSFKSPRVDKVIYGSVRVPIRVASR